MSALGRALDAAPRYVQLLRSQYWKPDQLRAYTGQHLARSLAAAARIPFYKDRLGRPPKPDDFARLPILERTDIASLNESVRSMYPPDHRFLWGASSGVTAIEAEFLFDRTRVRGRYAARIRFLRAHGWSPLRRTVFHQVSHRADSYPSTLEAMLQFLEDANLKLPSLRLVFTVGETVDDALRQRALQVLGVPIADNYGTTVDSSRGNVRKVTTTSTRSMFSSSWWMRPDATSHPAKWVGC